MGEEGKGIRKRKKKGEEEEEKKEEGEEGVQRATWFYDFAPTLG